MSSSRESPPRQCVIRPDDSILPGVPPLPRLAVTHIVSWGFKCLQLSLPGRPCRPPRVVRRGRHPGQENRTLGREWGSTPRVSPAGHASGRAAVFAFGLASPNPCVWCVTVA